MDRYVFAGDYEGRKSTKISPFSHYLKNFLNISLFFFITANGEYETVKNWRSWWCLYNNREQHHLNLPRIHIYLLESMPGLDCGMYHLLFLKEKIWGIRCPGVSACSLLYKQNWRAVQTVALLFTLWWHHWEENDLKPSTVHSVEVILLSVPEFASG